MKDILKRFNSLTQKKMEEKLKQIIQEAKQEAKEETYVETIKYLEMNGYIRMSGTMDMSFFKAANYDAKEGIRKLNEFYSDLDRKLGLS